MSGGKLAGYGGRLAGQAPNPYRGTAYVDSDGNLNIDDGKRILTDNGLPSAPAYSCRNSPDAGIEFGADIVRIVASAAHTATFKANVVNMLKYLVVADTLDVRGTTILANGTTQLITGVGDSIAVAHPVEDLSLDASYVSTATPFMPAGTDGQTVYLRNVGSFMLTLQDESVLPGSGIRSQGATNILFTDGDIMLFMYDTAGSAWVQKTVAMNT